MKILALDLGTRTGWAWGEPGSAMPRVGFRKLSTDVRERCGELHCWLDEFFEGGYLPDKIVVENFLNPAASLDADSTIGQIMLHGAVHGWAGKSSVDVVSVSINTLRVHFCGQATASPAVRGRPRTSAEKATARKATKNMVIERAKLLGYISRRSDQSWENESAMADAACVYDWALAHIARKPGKFSLFEARA